MIKHIISLLVIIILMIVSLFSFTYAGGDSTDTTLEVGSVINEQKKEASEIAKRDSRTSSQRAASLARTDFASPNTLKGALERNGFVDVKAYAGHVEAKNPETGRIAVFSTS